MPDPAPSGAPNETDRAENVKHLEMIQAVVTRLASNSFFIKGWTLTVAAAAFGFAVNRIDWRVAAAGIGIVVGFWFLDAYYLRQERLFRLLYNHVRRNITSELEDRFSMNLVPFADFTIVSRWKVFTSITLTVFYPTLIVAGLAVAFLTGTESAAAPAIPPPGP